MKQPLSDVKVIEIGDMVSAPYAAKLLADMGAEVIKVEQPGVGDRSRRLSEFPDYGAESNESALFMFVNANKLGITLDVSRPEGFEILEKLVAGADILIHNVLPPDMDRIGLNYERLCQANPKLIMTSVLPFGLTGSYRGYKGEDLNLWSASGACYISGGGTSDPDLPPLRTFGNPAAYQGGTQAAIATAAALMARDIGGEGQHVDVSVQESMVANGFTIEFWPFAHTFLSRLGQKIMQPLEAMEAKDGWIFLEISEEHQWQEFKKLMGDPQWAHEEIFNSRVLRAQNWDVLRPLLQTWVSQQNVLDLFKAAQEKKIPFAPVSRMQDLLASEHLNQHEFFVKSDHPKAGAFMYPRGPAIFSESPWELRCPAPTLGQHNEEILVGRLKLSTAALAALKHNGIV